MFSTSTPFESERGYSRFGAHGVLSHDGDFAGAARELRSRGYGGSEWLPSSPHLVDGSPAAEDEDAPTKLRFISMARLFERADDLIVTSLARWMEEQSYSGLGDPPRPASL